MASKTRLILRKKPNQEGLYPLAIRITKNRKSSYIYIGHYVDKEDWDEKNKEVRKSCPNANQLNMLLLSKLAEVNKKLIELQLDQTDISANQVKKQLVSNHSSTSFYDVAKAYLHELETNKKLTRLSSDKVRVNHLINFAASKQITFQEIDESFLKRFQSYLRNDRGLSERSVVNNLVVIRTLYNRAIKKGIVDRKLYPFGSDKIRIKFPETEKVGLTVEEVKAIEGLEYLSQKEYHARNVWLFSFYLAGIRVSDVLRIRWSDIYDGRIHYRMNKNSKLLSLLLPEKVIPILDFYITFKTTGDDFVFPEMKKANFKDAKDVYAKSKTATKKFNKYLALIAEKAGIKKKLTMHIARHTFGNIAGDKIPVQMLQKLYRHSTITTTMMYQSNFMNKEADKALNRVVGF